MKKQLLQFNSSNLFWVNYGMVTMMSVVSERLFQYNIETPNLRISDSIFGMTCMLLDVSSTGSSLPEGGH